MAKLSKCRAVDVLDWALGDFMAEGTILAQANLDDQKDREAEEMRQQPARDFMARFQRQGIGAE